MKPEQPGYVSLYHSGELERRAERLWARLASCDICPRECRVNRLDGELGFCRSGCLPIVASFCAHHGEEPALSGRRGSGTIFFGNCNLRCVYCQNYQISQRWESQQHNEVDCRILAEHMLYLQDELGCHNINLVSPSHFVPQIVRAVLESVPRGLKLPLVYNTNSYDSLATLRELDGIINIYLPDLKYAFDVGAKKLSQAERYVSVSRAAIKEMYRQVGNLVLDGTGVARRGMIVRHLILPGDLAGSRESLTWLAREVSSEVTVSIMSQYHPMHRAADFPPLARPISLPEHEAVLGLVEELGLENGWIQGMGAQKIYLPDFDRKRPFAAEG
jgi:putative pyruvate formate lyase activating enzyme